MDTNIFENKNVRALWDEEAKKWWFSAIDFCMVLTGKNYEDSRLYWKHLKQDLRDSKNQLVGKSYQLKMKSQDGKRRFTDVLDTEQILYLIQIIPAKEAEPYRLWLAKAAATGSAAADLLAALGKKYNESTRDEIIGDDKRQILHKTVERKEIIK